jgi:hypothetical protein
MGCVHLKASGVAATIKDQSEEMHIIIHQMAYDAPTHIGAARQTDLSLEQRGNAGKWGNQREGKMSPDP